MPADPIAILAVLAPLFAGVFAGSILAASSLGKETHDGYSDDERAKFMVGWAAFSERIPGHRLSVFGGGPSEPLRVVAACLEGNEVIAVCAELLLGRRVWQLRVFPERFPDATRGLARFPLPERRAGGVLVDDSLVREGAIEPLELEPQLVFDLVLAALVVSSRRAATWGAATGADGGSPVAVPL